MIFALRLKLFIIITSIFITYLVEYEINAQDIELVLFLIYPLCVICMLSINDVTKFLKIFRDFLKNINNYTRRKNEIKYVTPLGKTFNEYFSYLERKVFLLKKNNENASKDDFNNPINFLKKMDINPENTIQDFFQNILNILSGFYPKNAIVLFYYNKNTNNSFSLCSLSSTKHVSSFLKQLFLNHIVNKKEIKEGVITYYNVKNVLEDLSLFGYQKAILKKVGLSNDDSTIYMWLGASDENLSFLKEEKIFEALSYEISARFETFLKLKNAKNEIEKKTKEAIKKSEYLEFVSHDLRSPLANLVTILKLLEVNSDEKNKKEFIEIALNNCDSISILLEDLLDFSKYKSSNLNVCKENVNIETELKNVIANFNIRASSKNLELRFRNELKNKCAYLDCRQFRKIINNIISNAIKYTNKGYIEVLCKDKNGNIEIKIKDTGIGIKQENLKDIFLSFKRGENVENLEGYGLGLFMVKVFSELNNIKVHVDSTENVGTEFSLVFPFIKEQDKNIILKKKTNKIVVIEDDLDLLESTKRLLKMNGFFVQGFSNVVDAKNFLLANESDLILSDYYIGKERVDGLLEFLKENKINTDVILVTGKNDIDFIEYQKLGVKKIMQKPLEIWALKNYLKQ